MLFRSKLTGLNAFDLTAVWAVFDQFAGNPAAKSAIDMAIFDAQAKHLGITCAELLGGTPKALPVNRRLMAVYTLAAAYAGAAGALLAQTTAYVSLEVLEFNRSADVLLALIIGGPGWLYGGIAGALVFKILQDVLSSTAPQFWMFWMGLFLVALALVGRERLTRWVVRR